MKKVALHNLGCKVNSYELDSMKEQLQRAGYDIVPFAEGADIYIINTCTVTNIADRKSRQMLHKAKKLNPNAMVIAAGCYAQAAKDDIEKDQCIDFILGNNYKGKIVKAIEDWQADIDDEECYFSDINKECAFEDIPITNISGHVRAYIKIQDGCNRFCSYCIIPYVRGRVRSRTPESVIKEVKKLAENGVSEIILTGIQLSSYGVDFKNKDTHLLNIVKRINDIKGIERIRLGSLEPNIVDENFVNGLSKISSFCPHFHLSLQSGSDTVLKRMNRHYSTERYFEAVKMIRKYFVEPAVTTDIIVGFPGETEEEFYETCNFVKEIELAQTHIFKYSKRRGTKAETFQNQVYENIKNTRSNILTKICNDLEIKYLDKFLGKEEIVLLEEEYIKIDGEVYTLGHTARYTKVAIKGCLEKNKFIKVKIEKLNNDKKILIARREYESK